jgi:hypothetical protein
MMRERKPGFPIVERIVFGSGIGIVKCADGNGRLSNRRAKV